MKITLFFIGWNDAFYLPFIHKHYSQFCQRIVYYDNYSTDGSQQLAENLGFEVRTFGIAGVLHDHEYLVVKDHCWKEERGKSDFVIVCDSDEFIVPINLVKGANPVVTGMNMISEFLPEKDIFEVRHGVHSENYSKQAIFSPEITDINYVHGCHKNNIQSTLPIEGEAMLYHFRQIGGIQRLLDRHAEYRPRMSKFNLQHGMGVHYLFDEESKRREWDALKKEAFELW